MNLRTTQISSVALLLVVKVSEILELFSCKSFLSGFVF